MDCKHTNGHIEEFKNMYRYIEDGIKNYLRYISWPNEKLPMAVWVAYLSYLAMHISAAMVILSIFFPTMLVASILIFIICTVVSLVIILTYEPK